MRDPSLLHPVAAATAAYPGGHVDGYPDTFRALFAAVYADIVAGGPAAAPGVSDVRRRPRRGLVSDAVALRAATGAWAAVLG